MCNYCESSAFPLVDVLTQEHLEIKEVAGTLRKAVLTGSDDYANRLLGQLRDLLDQNARDECELLDELRSEGTLADGIERMTADYAYISAVLGGHDGRPQWPQVLTALDRLTDYFDNEEYGLFPAAVIALPIDAWDRITPAHASKI